jgi:cell wall-associated NlpC family hydrolase
VTSTNFTIPFTARNVARKAAQRLAVVLTMAVAYVPVSAVSSSGAGTTAVAAATSDPLAVAAATALDLLRGGSGKNLPTLPPVTAPVTSPSTLPPVTQPGTSPGVISPPSNVPPTSGPIGLAGLPGLSRLTGVTGLTDYNDQKLQFSALGAAPRTTAPVVSLLPPPVEETIPSAPTTAAPLTVSPSIASTTKATKKKKTTAPSSVAAVGAVADPSSGGSAQATPGTYDAARRLVAEIVAGRLPKLDVDRLDKDWAQADPRRMIAVYAALAQIGTAYRYSGTEPGGFDCSGLTSYAWGVAGVKLPRISTDQINATSARSAEQLLPGDLVWRPGHIMMFIGAGDYIVDSPQTGKNVMVRQWGHTSRYGSPI